MTLRKLVWMVRSRKQLEGYLVAWNAAAIMARIPITGKLFDPRAINPFGGEQSAEVRRKIEEVRAFIASRGFGRGG